MRAEGAAEAMARSLIDRHHLLEGIERRCCAKTQMEEMEIEQNTISRDWTIVHEDRRFFVNFTGSGGQTLALCNRENWEIHEETDDGTEELNAYAFGDSSLEARAKAQGNAEMIDMLIDFCLAHWENEVAWEMTERRERQRRSLEG